MEGIIRVCGVPSPSLSSRWLFILWFADWRNKRLAPWQSLCRFKTCWNLTLIWEQGSLFFMAFTNSVEHNAQCVCKSVVVLYHVTSGTRMAGIDLVTFSIICNKRVPIPCDVWCLIVMWWELQHPGWILRISVTSLTLWSLELNSDSNPWKEWKTVFISSNA
jgi:hypothetical protein